jgi:hypothetical protein
MPFDGAVDRVKLARPQMAPLTNAALDGATPHVKFAVRDPRPMASSPPIITQTYSRRHQTPSFEERPISCPSSLRVLRRQGAAKHKPR